MLVQKTFLPTKVFSHDWKNDSAIFEITFKDVNK